MLSVKELRVVLTLCARDGALIVTTAAPRRNDFVPFQVQEQDVALAIAAVGEYRNGPLLICQLPRSPLTPEPLAIARLYACTAAFALDAEVYLHLPGMFDPVLVRTWTTLDNSIAEPEIKVALIAA